MATGIQGYFVSKIGKCYKLTVTVYNECGSASDDSFFEIDSRAYRLKNPNGSIIEENSNYSDFRIQLFPNPVINHFNLTIEMNETDQVMIDILDIAGKKSDLLPIQLYQKELVKLTIT